MKFVLRFFLLLSLMIATVPAVSYAAGMSCESLFQQAEVAKPQRIKDVIDKSTQLVKYDFKSKVNDFTDFIHSTTWTQKAAITTKTLFLNISKSLGSAVSLLNPWPYPVFNKTAIIYNKQIHNPDYVPNAKEAEYLKNKNLEQRFNVRSEFLKKNPLFTFFRKTTKSAYSIAMGTVIALTAHQAVAFNHNTTDIKQYLAEPLPAHQVQLIIENGGLPHTAIRIGNRVYSYGQTHLSSNSVLEYMQMPQAAPVKVETKTLSDKVNFVVQGTQAQLAERSVKVIDLNLSREEALEIKRQLELSTAKRYHNITGVNDCNTMIMRILSKHNYTVPPPIVDSFPITTGTYLSFLQQIGSPLVGKTQLVIANSKNKTSQVVKSTWISLIEAKTMLITLPANAASRLYFDFKSTPETIEYYEPTTLAEINKWKQATNDEMAMQLSGFTADQRTTDISTDKLQMILEYVITPELNSLKPLIEDPNIEFQDIIIAEAKLDYLLNKKAEIEKILAARK